MIFWMLPDAATRTQDLMDNFLQPFKEANPDIAIQIRVINRKTLWGKIFDFKHVVTPDELPDLIAFPHYWTELLAQTGSLCNLSDADKTIRVDDCLAALQPHCRKGGKGDVYSAPWWCDVSSLHYRKDHLKLISSDPQKLLSTWQGLLEACKALKEHFGSEGYYPLQNSDWRGTLSSRGLLPCVWSRGADITDAAGCSGLGAPEFGQAVADYAALAQQGYMPVLGERSSTGNITSGRASMVITRKHGLSMFELSQSDLAVDTLNIPRTGAAHVNYMEALNLGITTLGKEPGNALKLLLWLTTAPNRQKYARGIEAFPVTQKGFNNFISAGPGRIKNYKEIFANARPLPSRLPTGTYMEVLGEMLSALSTAVASGKFSHSLLEAEVKEAHKDVQAISRLYGGKK